MATKQENPLDNLLDILTVLAKKEDGQSIEDIQNGLRFEIDRRTLQRRIKKLIAAGKVSQTGKGRATRYNIAKDSDNNTAGEEIDLLPISRAGEEIHQIVSQPTQKRTPVGYNRDFLENYRPNVSSYLSEGEKEMLANIGTTAQLEAPAGTYSKQVLQRLLIDLAWNSSRLEGNTYSLLDTQRLLSQGVSAENKSTAEAQMILNHKDAIEFIVKNTADIGFDRYTLLSLHALLSNNLLPNTASSGSLRTHGVGIAGSVYIPLAIPQLIEEMFELMLKKAAEIQNPFEQAFFIMVQLPYLQPFDDVNKRVSRLAANIPLSKKNLSPLSFTEVPEKLYINGLLGIYELNRIDLLKDIFLWAYDRSAKQYAAQRQSLGEPDPFRLKYRNEIRLLIAIIITEAMTQEAATGLTKARSMELPQEEQARFIQTIENELISLHEGNFARYFVSPSQFTNWQKVWNGK